MDVTAALLAAARRSSGGRAVESFAERRSAEGGGRGGGAVPSQFLRDAQDVASRVASTRRDVLDVVAVYGDVHAGGSGLTEQQRDDFDAKIASLLEDEQARILALGATVGAGGAAAGSLAAHQQAVVLSLQESKQELTNIVSELQLLRVRQALASKAALFTDNSGGGGGRDSHVAQLLEQDAAREKLRAQDRERRRRGERGEAPGETAAGGDGLRQRKTKGTPQSVWELDELRPEEEEEEDELDGETLKQLEQEQSALASQLHEEMQQAQQAEAQMQEFSELAELFAEKLSEQHNDIISLESDVGQSTQYMHRAGDELVSAKEHNKSFRKYVIVLFSVATLTLLIMDRMD